MSEPRSSWWENVDAGVYEVLALLLEYDPSLPEDFLYEVATRIKPELETLGSRAFTATYPLQIKRRWRAPKTVWGRRKLIKDLLVEFVREVAIDDRSERQLLLMIDAYTDELIQILAPIRKARRPGER